MLAHMTIDIRPELWRRARINAELSGVPLRDYISYLLITSKPIEEDPDQRAALNEQVRLNQEARRAGRRKE